MKWKEFQAAEISRFGQKASLETSVPGEHSKAIYLSNNRGLCRPAREFPFLTDHISGRGLSPTTCLALLPQPTSSSSPHTLLGRLSGPELPWSAGGETVRVCDNLIKVASDGGTWYHPSGDPINVLWVLFTHPITCRCPPPRISARKNDSFPSRGGNMGSLSVKDMSLEVGDQHYC